MAAQILDGKKLSEQLLESLQKEVAMLKGTGIVPCLAVILVGERPDSKLYVQKKHDACKKIGIESKNIFLPEKISEKELIEKIKNLNSDAAVHGILVQLPLPLHINREKILNSISPEKDVDSFCSESLGLLCQGTETLASCTAKGIIKLIESTGIKIEGKNACIINHSIVVGKPLALMLLNRNATVSICHKATKNISDFTKKADILVSAAGKKNLVSGEIIKQGAIVIDAGIFVEEKKVFGDVDFESAKKIASWLTPVPGGVGPMTVACLMENTIIAAKKILGV
ncbi:MAG: bifunctional 5,10-methylenetetrahydrofolate dehydrogenase/5,10-methenyltetrahydrofolate cyclohydrolase [Candidatus ainarchaeum sp.]|nr:bifunctional 5,10-methylenetetrahydrofolate dehydrogenase/5,10-methenyltetrahydrofolate cyclohydrolase [Candidatus ainarchaeum sp.]